jgi:hypothetical protein
MKSLWPSDTHSSFGMEIVLSRGQTLSLFLGGLGFVQRLKVSAPLPDVSHISLRLCNSTKLQGRELP